VSWIKLLSLFALVVALVVAPSAGDRGLGAERSALPSGAPDAPDAPDDDSLDEYALPSLSDALAAPVPVLTGRSLPENSSRPATSDPASRIFRPPISVRA
jgi:hypothetical protein